MDSVDRKAMRSSLTSEALARKREEVASLVPHYEAVIQRACRRAAKIPIDVSWESFTRSKRPDLALSTLHLWGSYFVLHRIADVIQEICSGGDIVVDPSATSSIATIDVSGTSSSDAFTSSTSTSTSSSSMPLYPGGRSIVASKLVRIIVQNEDKPLKGKDKVVLKPYLRKRKQPQQQQLQHDESAAVVVEIGEQEQLKEEQEQEEDEEVWVLTLRGNFGQGALGGFSRKRLVSTIARRLKLITPHHKALLDHVILPRCNAELARASATATATTATTTTAAIDEDELNVADDESSPLAAVPEGAGVEIAIDWETIDEDRDDRALRNLAAWGGYYSLAQVVHAFGEFFGGGGADADPARKRGGSAGRCRWARTAVQRVVVRHVPGQDATRKRCFVEAGTLFIDGVWELDGWQAGFQHHQIAEVLKQTYYLARCPQRGKKKFKYLKRALQSTNVLNGHIDYLKWILSQPCFQQPDEALTNAINDCLQPFVTKGEEYIHGWHCIKVNFRGQAQERIVVLTDCAVYTFAYDFAKNKIDDSRVHRHLHEHFKHITYGQYTNAAGGQNEYCLRYETHERVKKDKDAVKSGARSLGNVVAKAESAAALNQKVLGLVELMVDEQLGLNATTAADAGQVNADGEKKAAMLRREIDTGVKGFTCRRLLKLLGGTVLKYHDNYRLDVAHLLPGPAVGLIDVLGLVAGILDDHQHALFEGLAAVHAAGEPYRQDQVKLDNTPATTLHFVLKSLIAQLKALLVMRSSSSGSGSGGGDHQDECDSASLHNFTLAPPTPSSSCSSPSSSSSSVHILFFVSQLLKQMQRLERIEQVEIMTSGKRKPSRENSYIAAQSDGVATAARRPRGGTMSGPAANNRRMFHLPTPDPLPVSHVLQRIGDHLRELSLPPFRFPFSSPSQLYSAASTSSSSPSSPSSPPVLELADVCLPVEDLIEVVVKALIDKPIPAIEFPELRARKMVSVLERCVEPLLRLDLPPFHHPLVDQLLGTKTSRNKSSASSSSPSSGTSSSSPSSFFRKFIPEEPDTWVLLLKPSADVDDPDAGQDLVEEMGWAIYGAARTALRPWWAPKPERRGLTAPSSFFAQVYNKTGQGRSNRPSAAASATGAMPPSLSFSSSSPSSSSSFESGPGSAPAMVTRDSSLMASPPASQRGISSSFVLSPAMVAAAVDRRRLSMSSSSSSLSSSPSASPQ